MTEDTSEIDLPERPRCGALGLDGEGAFFAPSPKSSASKSKESFVVEMLPNVLVAMENGLNGLDLNGEGVV